MRAMPNNAPPPINMVLPGSVVHTVQYVEHPGYTPRLTGLPHSMMMPPFGMRPMLMPPPGLGPHSAANMMFPPMPMYPGPAYGMPPPGPTSSMAATNPSCSSISSKSNNSSTEERPSSLSASFQEKVRARVLDSEPREDPNETTTPIQVDMLSKEWIRAQWKAYTGQWNSDDAKTKERLRLLKQVEEDVTEFVVWMSANYRETLVADMGAEAQNLYYNDSDYPSEEFSELRLDDCNTSVDQSSSNSFNIFAKPWSPRAAKLQSQVAKAIYGEPPKPDESESAESFDPYSNRVSSAVPTDTEELKTPVLKSADSLPEVPDLDFGDDEPPRIPLFKPNDKASANVFCSFEDKPASAQSMSITDLSVTDESEAPVLKARPHPTKPKTPPPMSSTEFSDSEEDKIPAKKEEEPKPVEARRDSYIVDEDYAWLNDYTGPTSLKKPVASPVEEADKERNLSNFSHTSADAVTDNGNNRSLNEKSPMMPETPEKIKLTDNDEKENIRDNEDRYAHIRDMWENSFRQDTDRSASQCGLRTSVEAAHVHAGSMEIYPIGHDGLIIEDTSDARCIEVMKLENLLSDAELAECQPEKAATPVYLTRPPPPPVLPPIAEPKPEVKSLGSFAMDATSSTDLRVAALRVISRHGRIIMPELLRQMSIEKTKRLIAESSDDSPPPSGSQTPSVPLPCLERVRANSAGQQVRHLPTPDVSSTEASPSHSPRLYSPSEQLSPLNIAQDVERNPFGDEGLDLDVGSVNSESPPPEPMFNVRERFPSTLGDSGVGRTNTTANTEDIDLPPPLDPVAESPPQSPAASNEEEDEPGTPIRFSPVHYTRFSDQSDDDEECGTDSGSYKSYEPEDWDFEVQVGDNDTEGASPVRVWSKCELDPADCTEHSHAHSREPDEATLSEEFSADELKALEQNSESGDVPTDDEGVTATTDVPLLLRLKSRPVVSLKLQETDSSVDSSAPNSGTDEAKQSESGLPTTGSDESSGAMSSALDSESAPASSLSIVGSELNVISSISVTPDTERSQSKASASWRDGLDKETVAACDEFFSQI